MNKESVRSESGVQCVEEDHVLLVNGDEKSGALYVSVTRDGLILLCLYILSPHSLICSTNYNHLHSNPTLPWPILHLNHSTFFFPPCAFVCACTRVRLCANSL